MKTYIIKPEFIDRFGPEANAMTTLTEDDVQRFAEEWEMDEFDVRQQLIEIQPSGFTPIHRFAGKPDWQTLNTLIQEDSGNDEPYCETEEDYKRCFREGFLKYDGYYTTVYMDYMA